MFITILQDAAQQVERYRERQSCGSYLFFPFVQHARLHFTGRSKLPTITENQRQVELLHLLLGCLVPASLFLHSVVPVANFQQSGWENIRYGRTDAVVTIEQNVPTATFQTAIPATDLFS